MNDKTYEITDDEMLRRERELKELLYGSGIGEEEYNDTLRTDKYGFPIDEFKEDLKDAAWNVLYENPGSEFGDWQTTLIQQYPTEVVDALGTDPEDVYSQLADWWESMEYEDERTGICERFCDWAEYFCNERVVELYDMLVEAKDETRSLKAVSEQQNKN